VIITGLLVFNIFVGRPGFKIDESLDKSIAVLPILNISGDPGQEHISDGLTSDIISQLSKIRSFDKVVSFTTVLTYKNQGKKITEIANELGVNYILEGEYARMGDRLKVNTRLVEPGNDRTIWQDDFDRSRKEIVSIRSEIALQIADQLEAFISEPEQEKIQKVYTTSEEAWEKYQRGLYYLRKGRDRESLQTAHILFKESVALDPDFALAYTALADTYKSQFWYRFDPSPSLLIESKKAIDAAFRIDPELPEAYIMLGHYYYVGFLDFEKALDQYEIASELVPNHWMIGYYKALCLRRMGKWNESLNNFEQAFRIEPRNLDLIHNLADTYNSLHEFDEALEISGLGIEIDPDHPAAYEIRIDIYLIRDGNTLEARKILKEMETLNIQNNLLGSTLYISPVELDIFDGYYEEVSDFLISTDWDGLVNVGKYYPKSLFQARVFRLQNLREKAAIYYDSTRIELERQISENPNDPRFLGPLGVCLAALGNKEQAIQSGLMAVENYSMDKDAFFGLFRIEELAWIYVMVKEYDAALKQIEILLSNPGPYSAPLLQLDPKWKPLWSHPEFIRLVEKYSAN
jgi:TolB-like protein